MFYRFLFSFHEMGVYDTPAMVDYVIKQTGVQKHYHVGMSVGATVMFTFLAARPEYNKNVKLFVAQGPSVFLKGAKNALFTPIGEVSKIRLKLPKHLQFNCAVCLSSKLSKNLYSFLN